MPVNIGPKIGIDGEKEFRQNLNSISQQLKTLGTEMKAVTSAFDANDKSQENLANQSQVLTEQLSLQEKRIAEIQKALDHARSNYAENSNQVQRWQQAMNNAVAELNKTRSQLSKVQSEMDGTEDSTKDLTDALNDAGGASEKASGGLSSMTVAMGNLISSGIQAAASAVADLVSSLWNLDESTEEYRRAQGRLNTAFEAAGYGADTAQQAYQAFYGILGDTDTATEASQLLAQLAESEEDVATWTEIAAGVSGTFGDSLPIEGLIEAANETAKVGEVTGTLADALNWVGISEDEFNAKLAAAGSESERNRLIMNTLAGQYDEAGEAFYRNNEALVASRNAQAQMDAALAELGSAVSDVKTRMTAEFLPAVSQVTEGLAGMLTGTEGAEEQFSAGIGELIDTAVERLPEFLDFGVQIITTLLEGIISNIPALVEAIPQIITAIYEALVALWPTIQSAGTELLTMLADGILEYVPDMVSRLPDIITAFLDFMTENFPAILENGIAFLREFAVGIIDAIPDMVSKLPKIISSFAKFISENLPTIAKSGVELLLKLAAGIISAIPDLVKQLPQIIEAIVKGWLSMLSTIKDVGKEIVRGIWDGITSMASWITDKVTGFFSGIVDGVKDFLGIHSPSRVFADMGENMALGLGEGFAGEMRGVQRQIDRSMAGLVAPSMTYGVTAATSAPVYSGGDTIGATVGAAVRSALDGAAVYLNGRKVGNLITQQQNQTAIARGQSPVYI